MNDSQEDHITFDYDLSDAFKVLPELHSFEMQPKPFLVVLPSGLEHLEAIKKELAELGIDIDEEYDIDDFETFARYIYPIREDRPHSHVWLMLNRLFYGDHSKGKAIILDTNMILDYERIVYAKRHIRNVIGKKTFNVNHNGQNVEVTFHHLHAPDIDELDYQYNCLLNFTNNLEES